MKPILTITSLVGFTAATSKGLRLAYYEGEDCSGKRVGLNSAGSPEGLTAEGKCIPNPATNRTVRSVRVRGLEDDDDDNHWYYRNNAIQRTLRFYSSENCQTSCTELNIIEETNWDTCIDLAEDLSAGRSLKSLNIIEKGETGYGFDSLDRAFCFLDHGDEIVARGKQFRMWQVAAGLFREIPVEEWDAASFKKNTTRRFAVHGDVDARGKYKYWQDGPGSLDLVDIEEWDERKHQMMSDHWHRDLERYQWRLEYLCEDVPKDKIEKDGFITITDSIRVSCSKKLPKLVDNEDYQIIIDGQL